MAGSRFCLLLAVLFVCLSALSAGAQQGYDPYCGPVMFNDAPGMDNDGAAFGEGTAYPSIDASGRYIAFCRMYPEPTDPTQSRSAYEIWVRDRGANRSYLMSLSVYPVDGIEADGDSIEPVITADGRMVAFTSHATDLVEVDTNQRMDVFIRGIPSGPTDRVSVGGGGRQANNHSWGPAVSADGRYVAFTSGANNLAFGDNNGVTDVFVRDRLLNTTELGSVSSNGAVGNKRSERASISADGRYVAFMSEATNLVANDTNNVADIFVHDRQTGITERVNFSNWGEQADQGSSCPAISPDGNVVAYVSWATNLVPGDTNDVTDVFVYDRTARTTVRININPLSLETHGNCANPALSYTGRLVAYESDASDLYSLTSLPVLPQVFVYDRNRGSNSLVSFNRWWSDADTCNTDVPDGPSVRPSITWGGEFVGYTTSATNLSPYGISPGSPAILAMVRGLMDYRLFVDVHTYFWAYREIAALVSNGIIRGYTDTIPWDGEIGTPFRPSETVGRDAMAIFLARTLCGGDANVPNGPSTPSFSDVPLDHWAYKYIEYVKARGVITGYPDLLFHPEILVDRGMMATFIAVALAGDAGSVPVPPASPTFADVTATDPTWGWTYKYVEYIVSEGVTRGYDDGLYHPERLVTRDQMAVYVYRAFFS